MSGIRIERVRVESEAWCIMKDGVPVIPLDAIKMALLTCCTIVMVAAAYNFGNVAAQNYEMMIATAAPQGLCGMDHQCMKCVYSKSAIGNQLTYACHTFTEGDATEGGFYNPAIKQNASLNLTLPTAGNKTAHTMAVVPDKYVCHDATGEDGAPSVKCAWESGVET